MIHFDGPPSRWISNAGKPAPCVRGYASFEDDERKCVIWEFGVVTWNRTSLMMLPRSYGRAAALGPDHSLTNIYKGGPRYWRPLLYFLAYDQDQRLGSQQELQWRYGLMEAQLRQAFDHDFTMFEAEDRARATLLEHLTPQQLLELQAWDGKFHVRGAKTKNLYEIELGNGFALVDKNTHEIIVSYCLHPEEWIPHEDVALATKLMLEDPELEVECLENARTYMRDRFRPATHEERYAARLERELIV